MAATFVGYNAGDVIRADAGAGLDVVDVAADPASGTFFHADYKRHEDLKTMLDSNKDNLKLEAMKRIIGMVAKGKDASDLFPAVVKNVVSKKIEVKKLVYVYLVRYAEEQQDTALLSISTFQRALKDPNQLIRASALRVLSSIRVPMIAPIMMIAVKDAVTDMSPYVRKTAAHAIPKLYSLDPDLKEELVKILEKLLRDKTTLVAGSVVMAFEELCPERIDLIHKNYRKLCNLLVDVEEWGQVVIISMLTRYARTQFLDPNRQESGGDNDAEAFYSSGKDSADEDDGEKPAAPAKPQPHIMDPDHRLLLRVSKPLLQSRNAAVVMAVAQMYYHIAPKSDLGIIAKPLVRLIKSHREVQSIVLNNIASMSIENKGMFEPYIKSFFVRPMDPTHIRLFKLEILTNLATETSISTILREFQTYVSNSDKEFVAATIQAIGRCASSIPEVTDTCMNGLVSLMANKDETVVAESVVIIKKLLQMDPGKHKEIIVHMAKLVDKISVAMARASILWLIGEYSEYVPKIAPDVLRKMAKTFTTEEDIVKLQTLNLATKLMLTNSKQTRLLTQYVFNLAKYDVNYDIRDRARFLRQLVLPPSGDHKLSKYAKKIFLATKPAPVLESRFKDRDNFQLGSLAHYLNHKTDGYQELPGFPEVAPDTSVRNIEEPVEAQPPAWRQGQPGAKRRHTSKGSAGKRKTKSFYSDTSSGDDETSNEDESDTSEEESDEDESESNEDSDDEESSEEEEEERSSSVLVSVGEEKKREVGEEEDESSEEDEEDSEESSEEEEESSEEEVVVKGRSKKQVSDTKSKAGNITSLLDLDDAFSAGGGGGGGGAPTTLLTPSGAGGGNDLLKPTQADTSPQPVVNGTSSNTAEVTAMLGNMMLLNAASQYSKKRHELLNRLQGCGLSVTSRFTRTPNIYNDKMVNIDLELHNTTDKDINNVRIGNKKLQGQMSIHEFPAVSKLGAGEQVNVSLGVDFGDTAQAAKFEVLMRAEGSEHSFMCSLSAPIGESLRPRHVTEADFLVQQAKLRGMNEESSTVELPLKNCDDAVVNERVFEVANVALVPTKDDNTHRYSALTVSGGSVLLLTVKVEGKHTAHIAVNCDRMAVCSMMLKDVKAALCRV